MRHPTAKNFQLDLCTPADGPVEDDAGATTMSWGRPARFAFVGGRGAPAKTLGELQGEFALDVVPPHSDVPHLRLISDDLSDDLWQRVQARKQKTRAHYLRSADGRLLSKPEAGGSKV